MLGKVGGIGHNCLPIVVAECGYGTQIHHVVPSGFAGGFTSQQVIIKLSRWNAILEYMIGERWNKPVILCNFNTMRKKVLGKARIKGVKPKEYVKQELPKIVKHLHKFDRMNKRGDWDKHNGDMYDGIVCALYG